MPVEFHQTVRGARFYDHQLPNLMKTLEKVAQELERLNNNLETGKKEEATAKINKEN